MVMHFNLDRLTFPNYDELVEDIVKNYLKGNTTPLRHLWFGDDKQVLSFDVVINDFEYYIRFRCHGTEPTVYNSDGVACRRSYIGE